MAVSIIREQITQLEIDYYIFIAEIIEDHLLNDGRELTYWESKLEETVEELQRYRAYLEKAATEDAIETLLCLEFDVKSGVRDFLASGLELLANRVNRLERRIEARESIGTIMSKDDSHRLLKYRYKLSKLRSYFNSFEENFEVDMQLFKKYLSW